MNLKKEKGGIWEDFKGGKEKNNLISSLSQK